MHEDNKLQPDRRLKIKTRGEPLIKSVEMADNVFKERVEADFHIVPEGIKGEVEKFEKFILDIEGKTDLDLKRRIRKIIQTYTNQKRKKLIIDEFYEIINVLKERFRNIIVSEPKLKEKRMNIDEINVIINTFSRASQIAKERGFQRTSEELYVKRQIYRKKLFFYDKNRFFIKWLQYWIWWCISRFGISPIRLITWIVLIISGFAIFGYSEVNCLECDPVNKVEKLIDYFYWSMITFSSLGYGDCAPTCTMLKIISGLESMVGLLMFGLFIDILNRRLRIGD